ncbi:hypothetical protein IE53DRAFT_256086 [Violaceomyces palustris]|uniref:Uncharacterized protein n=1 Tax=Violaceomyces palustris TaxID=1673888 RepID=A0ACD0NNI3_9BASI|nr:hypothetical protein IE53DRAFT_256086 [Violaceomyces palustris]
MINSEEISSRLLPPGSHALTRHSLIKQSQDFSWEGLSPPPYPPPRERLYKSCYCEENSYHLVDYLSRKLSLLNASALATTPSTSDSDRSLIPVWDARVIFVSNPTKSVILWCQKASQSPNSGYPVIWDYHVFVAVTCTLTTASERRRASAAHLKDPSVSPDGPTRSRSGSKSKGLQFFKAVPSSKSSDGRRSGSSDDVAEDEFRRTWIYDPDSLASLVHGEKGDGERAAPGDHSKEEPSPMPLSFYLSATFRPAMVELAGIPVELRSSFRIIPAGDFLDHFASDRSHMLVPSPSSSSSHPDRVWASPPPEWPCIVGPESQRRRIRNNLMEKYVDINLDVGCSGRDDGAYGSLLKDFLFFQSRWCKSENAGETLLRVGGPACLPSGTRGMERSMGPEANPHEVFLGAKGESAGSNLGSVLSLPIRKPSSLPCAQRGEQASEFGFVPTALHPPNPRDPSVQPHAAAWTDRARPATLPESIQGLGASESNAVSSGSGRAHSLSVSEGGNQQKKRKGGRVTSPLFPAYLAASLQHRAGRARGSYLGLGPDWDVSGLSKKSSSMVNMNRCFDMTTVKESDQPEGSSRGKSLNLDQTAVRERQGPITTDRRTDGGMLPSLKARSDPLLKERKGSDHLGPHATWQIKRRAVEVGFFRGFF